MRIALVEPGRRRRSSCLCDITKIYLGWMIQGLKQRGIEVTLFADDASEGAGWDPSGVRESSLALRAGVRYAEIFQQAENFDFMHTWFDPEAVTYSGLISRPMLATLSDISGSTEAALYAAYDPGVFYVSMAGTNRSPDLSYAATIHHGAQVSSTAWIKSPTQKIAFLDGIHPHSHVEAVITAAESAGLEIILLGEVFDTAFYETIVAPHVDSGTVRHWNGRSLTALEEELGDALGVLTFGANDGPTQLLLAHLNTHGIPIAAPDSAAMREIVTPGENGVLFAGPDSAQDGLQRFSDISRDACRGAAQKIFCFEKTLDAYIEVYDRIMALRHTEDRRPWGYYKVLSDKPDHKVKRIVVYPGKRLSLQSHEHRYEEWTIISGHPTVSLNDKELFLHPGQSVHIPLGAKHRVSNPGEDKVVFIEVQTGTYFGEDDIKRYEDDFGRLA